MIRLLIADNHQLLRAGIRSLIAGRNDIQVVGEASDGVKALELIGQLQPDVVLMDIKMPLMNGIEATIRATEKYPNTRIVVLSMHLDEEYVLRALRAGAAGYLIKDSNAAELEEAIVRVARGETYIAPSLSHVLSDFVRRNTGVVDPLARLTPRQREVLQLIAEGRATKEIADLLGVTGKTVETHRMRLMAALDLHDVAALVRFAIRCGVISAGRD